MERKQIEAGQWDGRSGSSESQADSLESGGAVSPKGGKEEGSFCFLSDEFKEAHACETDDDARKGGKGRRIVCADISNIPLPTEEHPNVCPR